MSLLSPRYCQVHKIVYCVETYLWFALSTWTCRFLVCCADDLKQRVSVVSLQLGKFIEQTWTKLALGQHVGEAWWYEREDEGWKKCMTNTFKQHVTTMCHMCHRNMTNQGVAWYLSNTQSTFVLNNTLNSVINQSPQMNKYYQVMAAGTLYPTLLCFETWNSENNRWTVRGRGLSTVWRSKAS